MCITQIHHGDSTESGHCKYNTDLIAHRHCTILSIDTTLVDNNKEWIHYNDNNIRNMPYHYIDTDYVKVHVVHCTTTYKSTIMTTYTEKCCPYSVHTTFNRGW